MEKGIRLERVAEETRIGLGTLEAIEQEDFSRLPPEVFMTGFLRAFAKAVGADGEEAVKRYGIQRAAALRTEQVDGEPERLRAGRGGKLALCLGLWVVLVAATLFGYQTWHVPQGGHAAPGAAPPHAEPLNETGKSPDLPPPAAAGQDGGKAPAAGYELRIQATEDSWIKVVIDQGHPVEKALKAGEELRLEAVSDINLLIGNAAGVCLTLNGKPVPVTGKRGEVVSLRLP
jgi:cytoskeletal protein RodZ